MRAFHLALLAAVAALMLPAAAVAAPGDPDTSTTTAFGGRSTDVGTVLFPGADKTIVAGSSSGIALARYTSAGALDSGFGTGGKVESAWPGGGTPVVGAATLWGTRIAV